MSSRKALCAIPLLAVLGLLGWLARSPAGNVPVTQSTLAASPPIERLRREVALDTTHLPDVPWMLAEDADAPAASSPSGPASRCGQDERPRFDDTGGVVAPAGEGYVAARHRLDAALRTSAQPLAGALADRLDLEALHTPEQRVDALVQRALATRDARVYAFAYRSCPSDGDAPASCALLNARQWAQLDDGNAVPWLYLLNQARRDGDAVAEREALGRLASSQRFDEGFGATAGLVAGLVSDVDTDQAAASDVMRAATGIAAAQFVPYQALLEACHDHDVDDDTRGPTCTRIAELMFDHSDSLVERSIAGGLYLAVTGDAALRDRARAEQTAVSDHWTPATGFSACNEMRTERRYFKRVAEVGEVAAAKEVAAAAVPP